jgi:hypothetical protein
MKQSYFNFSLEDGFRPVAVEVDNTNQWIFVGTQQEIRQISLKNGTVSILSLFCQLSHFYLF